MKNTLVKRLTSFLLCICILTGMLPASFAAETADGTPQAELPVIGSGDDIVIVNPDGTVSTGQPEEPPSEGETDESAAPAGDAETVSPDAGEATGDAQPAAPEDPAEQQPCEKCGGNHAADEACGEFPACDICGERHALNEPCPLPEAFREYSFTFPENDEETQTGVTTENLVLRPYDCDVCGERHLLGACKKQVLLSGSVDGAADETVWDGLSFDTSWYVNQPTATEYTLTTAAQLAGLALLVGQTIEGTGSPALDGSVVTMEGRTIRLGADIDLNNGNWRPIGLALMNDNDKMDNARQFLGAFDGGGHTVRGVSLKAWNTLGVMPMQGSKNLTVACGLFGALGGTAAVSNLNVEVTDGEFPLQNMNWTDIEGGVIAPGSETRRFYAGAVAGYLAEGASLDAVKATIEGEFWCDTGAADAAGRFAEAYLGGAVGYAADNAELYGVSATVKDELADVSAESTARAGGLAGYLGAANVEQCRAQVWKNLAGAQAGGLVGEGVGTAMIACYAWLTQDAQLDSQQAGGLLAGALSGGADLWQLYAADWSAAARESGYPAVGSAGDTLFDAVYTASMNNAEAKPTTEGVTSVPFASMNKKTSYAGFDFADAWQLDASKKFLPQFKKSETQETFLMGALTLSNTAGEGRTIPGDTLYADVSGVEFAALRNSDDVTYRWFRTDSSHNRSEIPSADGKSSYIVQTKDDGYVIGVEMLGAQTDGFVVNTLRAESGRVSATALWEDVADTSWLSDADGTEDDPYVIEDGFDLAGFARLVQSGTSDSTDFAGKYIRLASDIDLTGREWTPIGGFSTNSGFAGTFDGDGHLIHGVNVSRVFGTKYAGYTVAAGLFGSVLGGTVRNVHVNVKNMDVNAITEKSVYVGGLAGYVGEGSTVEHCYVTVNGVLNGVNPNRVALVVNNTARGACRSFAAIGGLIGATQMDKGEIDAITIAGCSATMADGSQMITNGSRSAAGGIVGLCARGTVIDSCRAVLGADVSMAAKAQLDSRSDSSYYKTWQSTCFGGVTGMRRAYGYYDFYYYHYNGNTTSTDGGKGESDDFKAFGFPKLSNIGVEYTDAFDIYQVNVAGNAYQRALFFFDLADPEIGAENSYSIFRPGALTLGKDTIWHQATGTYYYSNKTPETANGAKRIYAAEQAASYPKFDFTNQWFQVEGYTAPVPRALVQAAGKGIALSGKGWNGQKLTASASGGSTEGFRWYRDGEELPDYYGLGEIPLSDEDIGHTYQVKALQEFTQGVYLYQDLYSNESVAVNDSNLTGQVSILPDSGTQNPKVGETLTAAFTDTGLSQGVQYQWYRVRTDASGKEELEEISGAADAAYTLTEADAGCYLSVTATPPSGYVGSFTARTKLRVRQSLNGTTNFKAPYNADSGSIAHGETIALVTDEIRPAAARDTLVYRWRLLEPGSSTWKVLAANASANSIQWEAETASNQGRFGSLASLPASAENGIAQGATVEVTVKSSDKTVFPGEFTRSTAVGVLPLGGTLGLKSGSELCAEGGEADAGQPLTADLSRVTPGGVQGGVTYAWYVDGVLLSEQTGSSYTPGLEAVGKTVELRVTGSGGYSGRLTASVHCVGAKLTGAFAIVDETGRALAQAELGAKLRADLSGIYPAYARADGNLRLRWVAGNQTPGDWFTPSQIEEKLYSVSLEDVTQGRAITLEAALTENSLLGGALPDSASVAMKDKALTGSLAIAVGAEEKAGNLTAHYRAEVSGLNLGADETAGLPAAEARFTYRWTAKDAAGNPVDLGADADKAAAPDVNLPALRAQGGTLTLTVQAAAGTGYTGGMTQSVPLRKLSIGGDPKLVSSNAELMEKGFGNPGDTLSFTQGSVPAANWPLLDTQWSYTNARNETKMETTAAGASWKIPSAGGVNRVAAKLVGRAGTAMEGMESGEYYVQIIEGEDTTGIGREPVGGWKTYQPSDFANASADTTEYYINSVEEFASFRDKVNGLNGMSAFDFAGCIVYLCADLDMSSAGEWVGIGTSSYRSFCGTFDGQNHKIYNIKGASSNKRKAVFDYLTHKTVNGVVYNPTIKNVQYTWALTDSGPLVGSLSTNSSYVGGMYDCMGVIPAGTIGSMYSNYAVGALGANVNAGYNCKGIIEKGAILLNDAGNEYYNYYGGVFGTSEKASHCIGINAGTIKIARAEPMSCVGGVNGNGKAWDSAGSFTGEIIWTGNGVTTSTLIIGGVTALNSVCIRCKGVVDPAAPVKPALELKSTDSNVSVSIGGVAGRRSLGSWGELNGTYILPSTNNLLASFGGAGTDNSTDSYGKNNAIIDAANVTTTGRIYIGGVGNSCSIGSWGKLNVQYTGGKAPAYIGPVGDGSTGRNQYNSIGEYGSEFKVTKGSGAIYGGTIGYDLMNARNNLSWWDRDEDEIAANFTQYTKIENPAAGSTDTVKAYNGIGAANQAAALETIGALEGGIIPGTFPTAFTANPWDWVHPLYQEDAKYQPDIDKAETYFAATKDGRPYLHRLMNANWELEMNETWPKMSGESASLEHGLLGLKITGTPAVGQTLMADVSSVAPAAAGEYLTGPFQWYRVNDAGEETEISGQTDADYVVTEADMGYRLRAKTTLPQEYNTEELLGIVLTNRTATATTSDAVGKAALSGALDLNEPEALHVGAALAATLTEDCNLEENDLTYQWYRGTTGATATNAIAGANELTYAPTAADIGCYLRLVVTARANSSGVTEGSALEATTTKPVGLKKLTGRISFNDGEGLSPSDVLTATLTDFPEVPLEYRWQSVTDTGAADLGSGSVSGSTVAITVPQSALGGKLRLSVTTTNAAYAPGGVSKDTDVTVGAAALGGSVKVLNQDENGKERAYLAPTMQLTLDLTQLDPADAAYSIQWTRANGSTVTDIPGATGETYTTTAEDIGSRIGVRITGTGKYAGTLTDTLMQLVQEVKFTATAALQTPPLLESSVGQTLTAKATVTARHDDIPLTKENTAWKWYRVGLSRTETELIGSKDGDPVLTDGSISEATSSYVITKADIGCTIYAKFVGTGVYAGSKAETLPAPKVSKLPAPPAPKPGITPPNAAGNNAKLTGLSAAPEGQEAYTYEYRLVWEGQAADADWSPVAAGKTEITGLTLGAYEVRIQETDTRYGSASATVEILEPLVVRAAKYLASDEGLSFVLSPNESWSQVTEMLNLVSTLSGYDGIAITWTANKEGCMDETGLVMPAEGAENVDGLILTATLTYTGEDAYERSAGSRTVALPEATLIAPAPKEDITETHHDFTIDSTEGKYGGKLTLKLDGKALTAKPGDGVWYVEWTYPATAEDGSAYDKTISAANNLYELTLDEPDYVGKQISAKLTKNGAKGELSALSDEIAKGAQEPPKDYRVSAPEKSGDAGKLSMLNAALDYEYVKAGVDGKPAEGENTVLLTGASSYELAPGEYLLRFAENSFALASGWVEITVPKSNADRIKDWLNSLTAEDMLDTFADKAQKPDAVTKDLNLPHTTGNNIPGLAPQEVTWAGEPADVIKPDGTVTRGETNQTVQFTPSVTYNGETITRDDPLKYTVKKLETLRGTLSLTRWTPNEDGKTYTEDSAWNSAQVVKAGDKLTANLTGVNATAQQVDFCWYDAADPKKKQVGQNKSEFIIPEKLAGKTIQLKISAKDTSDLMDGETTPDTIGMDGAVGSGAQVDKLDREAPTYLVPQLEGVVEGMIPTLQYQYVRKTDFDDATNKDTVVWNDVPEGSESFTFTQESDIGASYYFRVAETEFYHASDKAELTLPESVVRANFIVRDLMRANSALAERNPQYTFTRIDADTGALLQILKKDEKLTGPYNQLEMTQDGTYRLEVRADGYLPYVVQYSGMDITQGNVLGYVQINMVQGKVKSSGAYPNQIAAEDRIYLQNYLNGDLNSKANTASKKNAIKLCDFNGNKMVDVVDMSVLLQNIGKQSKGAVTGKNYGGYDVQVDQAGKRQEATER